MNRKQFWNGKCNETMHELFPLRTVVIEQSLDMFGVKRNEDGTLLFPRHSNKRFPRFRMIDRFVNVRTVYG